APAVGFDQSPGDEQAESDTGASVFLRLPEAVEDVRQRVFANALPRIRHAEDRTASGAFRLHRDQAAFWSELDRVADQVRQDLQHPFAIAPHTQTGTGQGVQMELFL